PGQAVSLAERTLEVEDVAVEERMKLITCLGRSAANIGQAQRAQAAVAEVDRLLAANPMPPEFRLRALSNSGATLHTLGKMQAALDYYGRAYQAARQSESEIAQVAMLGNVGAIHSEGLGAYAQAEDYFARADEIARRS